MESISGLKFINNFYHFYIIRRNFSHFFFYVATFAAAAAAFITRLLNILRTCRFIPSVIVIFTLQTTPAAAENSKSNSSFS
mmetsp:Transcript_28291/g.45507  ORF Transcript_28291/g.45507 Transcript_28291/m.45507 type:complete len:81 (+) Transcript_28291:482-724(+)